MKHSVFNRLLALLLCMAMLLPYLDALPVWASTEDTGLQAESPNAIVYAGSDFQYLGVDTDGDGTRDPVYNNVTYADIYSANAVVMKEILDRIKQDYPNMDGAFLLGDYSNNYDAASADSGMAAVNGVLKETWGLDYDQTLFVQGNHDASGNLAGLEHVDTTGAHDTEHYGVYQINHDDFSWGQSSLSGQATVQNTADALEAYLTEKADDGYKKPIFVITHLPLHHTWRGDNLWAELLADVLNEAGAAGLNIIFMYGHNHSGSYDNYIGGDCVYLQPGEQLVVTDCDQYVSGMDAAARLNMYESLELKFTYMNAGYLGYSAGELTSTVFEIYDDRVELARYSKNGLVDLRKTGVKSSSDGDWPAVTTNVLSPQTLSLSGISLSVLQNTLGETLLKDGTAFIQIGIEPEGDYNVNWVSMDGDVVIAASDPSDPTQAILSGVGYGTTTVKVTVSDKKDPDAIPASIYFDVTVAPENAIRFNESDASSLYRLVTDWSTIKDGMKFMILNRDTAGVGVALAGPETASNRDRFDPSTVQTNPAVFQLSGAEGLYTASMNGQDVWELRLYGTGEAPHLHQVSDTASFMAVTKVVDAAMGYSYECGFRFASSYQSGGAARWTVDAQNKALNLHSYYNSGYVTPTDSFGLYYDSNDGCFEISAEAGSPVHIYEWTGVKGPEMWMWLTSDSGNIVVEGNDVTGAKVAIMEDGVVREIPITADMLRGGYTEIPGTRTCSVYCYGQLVSDQFQITITAEDGTVIKPVTLLENNGTLYKLHRTNLNGADFVSVDRKTAGSGVAMVVAQVEGEYRLVPAETEVMNIDGLDGLYVKAQNDGWVWKQEATGTGGHYYLKNSLNGKYLRTDGTAGTELLMVDTIDATGRWRVNSTDYTLTEYVSDLVIGRVGDGYIAAGRNGYGVGVGYVYVPDTELDKILAYMTDYTGTTQVGASGALSSGETISRTIYYQNGTSETENIPVTLEMLDVSAVDLCVPGDYLCTVTYNGRVICENFLLTVESTEGEVVADKPVIFAEEGQIFKMVTSMAAGNDYVILSTKTPGPTYAVSVAEHDGVYTFPAVATDAFTVAGTDALFVVARDDSWVFTTSNSDVAGRYFLYNNLHQGYLYGATDTDLAFSEQPPAGTNNWRYSGTMGAVAASPAAAGNGLLHNSGGNYTIGTASMVAAAVRPQVFIRDDSIKTIVAYVDSVEGTTTIGGGTTVTGGNVVIRSILADGTLDTRTVPITLDMLDVSPVVLLTPGKHICKVVYDGVVISQNYELTVTSTVAAPAAEPVNLATKWKFFKRVTAEAGFAAGGTYVMVDTDTQEMANVMTALETEGGYAVTSATTQVLEYNGSQYVIVKDDSWLWDAAKHSLGLSLQHKASGQYLGGDTNYQLVLRDAPSDSYGWRYSSSFNVATTSNSVPEGATYAKSSDITFRDGAFQLTVRNAVNTDWHVYPYEPDDAVQAMVAYPTSLKGQCDINSPGDAEVGGSIVINTLVNGTTVQQVVPITLGMLNLTNDQRLIPNTYTCELIYEGQVLTTEYEITLTSTTGENPPASQVVTLVQPGDLVFRSTEGTWGAGNRYIVVDSRVEGAANVMGVKTVDGKPAIIAQQGAVFTFEGSGYTYFTVSDPDLIWKTQTSVVTSTGETVQALNNQFFRHEQTGNFLFVEEDFDLLVADPDTLATNPNGWHITGGQLTTGASASPPYAELYCVGDTFKARNRINGADMAYVYILSDVVNTRLAYADALVGSCATGADFSTECGGNVVIKTLLDDSTSQIKIVPITLDMLSVDYVQLLIPGTYTCTLTYEGKVISEDYTLTVQPAEGERPAVTDPVVLIEEGEKVFRLYNSSSEWVTGGEYMFVTTQTAGEATIVGTTPDGKGGYTVTTHDGETFTVGTDGNVYVVSGADHQIWTIQRSVTTDSGTVTANSFFIRNTVYGKYLFVNSDYDLLLTDANTVGTITNGWRVSSKGLVTGVDGDLYPYADLAPRGPRFVARFRRITSGNAVDTARVYVRDHNIVTSLAYLDQQSGMSSVNSADIHACGGNVVIKTVLADGSVVTDTVPITLDMLRLSYEDKHTPGTYTCEVVCRGEVICSDYQLTVTGDEQYPQADKPVVMFDPSRPVFKLVGEFTANQSYVFVDSREPGKASAMTHGTNGTFPGEDAQVFFIDGRTSEHVVVEDSSCIWKTEYMYDNRQSAGVYTLYDPVSGKYLHVNNALQMVMTDRQNAVPANSGWIAQGGTYVLGNGASTENPYVTIRNAKGSFVAADRNVDASDINAAYIYEIDDTLEGQVAYVTALAGTCTTGGSYEIPIGGSVVVKTYLADGDVITEEVPINLSMIEGIDPLELFVAGTHTCSVVYQGEVITDRYVLTIESDGNAAASNPVELAKKGDLIFKRVTNLQAGEQYVFVTAREDGRGYALTVIMEDGVFVLNDPVTTVSNDGINTITIAKSGAWIWNSIAREGGQVYLYNDIAGAYLLARDENALKLGQTFDPAYGWRLSTDENLGINLGPYYTDVVNNGSGFYMQRRNDSDHTGHTYAFQRDDTIELVLGYMDSLAGEIQVGQTGMVYPGGNVIVKTFYEDGNSGSATVPVTLDMLDLTLEQLNTPGVYTCKVTYNGDVITDEYVLTVTGEEKVGMILFPSDDRTVLGYLTTLDGNISNELPVGSGGRIPTGNTIEYYTYYADGTVELTEEPVTVDMLNCTTEQLNTHGTYSGLTLTYRNLLITDNYTLRFSEVLESDYPDFPDEGSVKVDKQADTTKFHYQDTGTAQIELSLAGIPTTSKANVIFVLDGSSSMTACTHGIYNHQLTAEENQIIQKMIDMEEPLTQDEIDFLTETLVFPGYSDPEKHMARVQAAINRTITDGEMTSLKTALSFYGYCIITEKWVGITEDHCKTRAQVTKDALAETLEYLKHDIQGYAMDVDVAVADFSRFYPMAEDMIFTDNQDKQVVVKRDPNELMLPFIDIEDVDSSEVIAKYTTASGTNYDRGMELAYQLLAEKQTQDYLEYLASGSTEPFKPRQDFVLFMSDGAPGQFNYMITNNSDEFTNFHNGNLKEPLSQYVDASKVEIFDGLYNREGKMWLAEAIKGEKTQMYKVIDPSMPETNYVSSAAGLGAILMTVSLNASTAANVLTRIASGEDYYYPTETGDDIREAFKAFGILVASAGDAAFKDQMGPEFDLQMSNTVEVSNIKDLYQPGTNSWETFTGTKTTRTVYFNNGEAEWDAVHIYTWDSNGNFYTGAWPGAAMTHIGNGICTFEIPADAVYVQFNNGSDSAKIDGLTIPAGGNCLYRPDTGAWVSYGTRTVYFDATGCSWSDIKAHTWGGSGISTTGGWPGAQMVYLGNNIYSCAVPADATGIIFNDSSNQTGNLTIPTDGRNMYHYSSGSWDTYATRTIYFNNSGKHWDTVYAYTWDEGGLYTTSDFPGMAMTHLGNGIHACQIPADTVNILFNAGSNTNQTADLTVPATEIQLNSTITVSLYELYKHSEHLQDPETVTMDMVGKRKGTDPVILEQVTFSDDGTEAYSTLIDDGKTNILIDGVICAQYFWYNTYTDQSVMIDVNRNGTSETQLEPETFYWSIDSIPEDELVFSYNVYLTGSQEGTRTEGSFATNNYATLEYTNHLGNECSLDTTSPIVPWYQAVVGYGFYLVDTEGNPIVNKEQGLTGSFEKAIRVTQPQYMDLLYNSAENEDPWKVKASNLLPDGYVLYDSTAAYYVSLYDDGRGSWQITGDNAKDTTYVTGYGGVPTTVREATAGTSTSVQTYDYPAYATASTVAWFAVVAYEDIMMTDKTVEAVEGKDDEFTLTLDAFASGSTSMVTTTKPADVVLVLDQSASMYAPVGLSADQYYAYKGHADNPELPASARIDDFSQKVRAGDQTILNNAKHLGYYIALHNEKDYMYIVQYAEYETGKWGWFYVPVNVTSTAVEVDTANTTNNTVVALYTDTSSNAIDSLGNPIYFVPNPKGGYMPNPNLRSKFGTYAQDDRSILDNVTYYKTQYGALYDSVNKFVSDLSVQAAENNVDHRVSIVGFSSPYYDGHTNYDGTGLYIDGNYYLYDADYRYMGYSNAASDTGYTLYVKPADYQRMKGILPDDKKGNLWTDTLPSGVTEEDLVPIDPNTAGDYFIPEKTVTLPDNVVEDEHYTRALMSVLDGNGDLNANVTASIEAIRTNYLQTCPAIGLRIARSIFRGEEIPLVDPGLADSNTTSEELIKLADPTDEYSKDRERIIVLFTDGTPTLSMYSNQEDGKTENAEIKNEYWTGNSGVRDAINEANAAKREGIKVYTIGTAAASRQYGNMGEAATATTKVEFLELVSSNYPASNSVYDAIPYADNNEDIEVYNFYVNYGTQAADSYALSAREGVDMSTVFETVMKSITVPLALFGSETVLKEVLSDYFDLAVQTEDQLESNISVYTADYLGVDENGNHLFSEELVPFEDAKIEIVKATDGRYDTINVTNFDYSTEYVGVYDGTPRGRKLVVKVGVKVREGFWGGNNVPTNDMATAIYTDAEETVARFPVPEANVAASVQIKTKDQTIYYGSTLDADKLVDQITVSGVAVEIGKDGSLTAQADWMDDYATLSWTKGFTVPGQSVINTHKEETYPFSVTLAPVYDGVTDSTDPSGSLTGTAQKTVTAAAEADVYVLVPVITWQDATIELGDDVEKELFEKEANLVRLTWVQQSWMEAQMETIPVDANQVPGFDADSEDYPNPNPNTIPLPEQAAPELTYHYSVSGKPVEDTPVEVKVLLNGTEITDAAYFMWQVCTYELGQHNIKRDQISVHRGDMVSREFYIHVEGGDALVSNKTVADLGDGIYELTMEGSVTGSITDITVTKPADIVLVLDHSGSMRTPAGATGVLNNSTLYSTVGHLTVDELDETKGAHMGYYVAQSKATKSWFILQYADGLWNCYLVPTTESVVDPTSGGYTEHTKVLSWTHNGLQTDPDALNLVYYYSHYAMLYDSVLSFVDGLRETGVEHTVSVVGFAGPNSQGSRVYVSGFNSRTQEYETVYKSFNAMYHTNTSQERRDELFRMAMKNVQDDTQYAELLTNINAVETNYSYTSPSSGLQLADDLFDANAADRDADRDRIVVLFTDGIPNRSLQDWVSDKDEDQSGVNGGESSKLTQTQLYDEIISMAHKIKKPQSEGGHGATFYSASPSSMLTTAGSASGTTDFLLYASSDYPDAVSMESTGDPVTAEPQYTYQIEGVDDLQPVFNTVTHQVAGTQVQLDDTAVLRDTLSDYFILEGSVVAYMQAYLGGNAWGPLEPITDENLKIIYSSTDGEKIDTIEVSGFHYSEHYLSEQGVTRTVTLADGTRTTVDYYRGSRLVVKVQIKTREDFWGGVTVPTNTSDAGIFGSYGEELDPFPIPETYVPYKYLLQSDTVVVDFGLPVNIDVTGNDDTLPNYADTTLMGILRGDAPEKTATGSHDEAYTQQVQSDHGVLTALEDGRLCYELSDMRMDQSEIFVYELEYKANRDSSLLYNYATVTVIPATTIYYEDNTDFVKYHEQSDSAIVDVLDENGNPVTDEDGNVLQEYVDRLATWVSDDDDTTAADTQNQDRPGVSSVLAKLDADNIYGYDGNYTTSSKYSNGSAHKVQVYRNADGSTVNARATFTFTGTGFDIISLCNNATGVLSVSVWEGTDNIVMEDNPYTPEYEITDPALTYVVDSWYQAGELYQVPLIKVDMNQVKVYDENWQWTGEYYGYGTYTVELYIAPGWYPKDHSYNGCDFYLDSIRVYNPAGSGGETDKNAYDAYIADGECWPVYAELRNMFIDGDAVTNDPTSGKILFIDKVQNPDAGETGTDLVPTISTYQSWGPNNEVYLATDQSVAFTLDASKYSGSVAAVHLAMRGITGQADVLVQYQDGDQTTDLINTKDGKTDKLSATDLYYDITQAMGKVLVITNHGSDPIALSTLKVTHNAMPVESSNAGGVVYTDEITGTTAIEILTPEELAEPSVTPKRPALSFNGLICYNVFFTAEDLGDLTAADLGLAVFNSNVPDGTVENADEVHLGATEIDGEYMVATDGVNAKYLGDTKYFRAFARKADGSYVYSKMVSYSARDYATNILANSQDVKLKQLVIAMLNYGAEAQKFFGYKTDDLMNKDLTADHQALLNGFSADSLNAATKADAAKVGAFANNGGFSKRTPAISFNGAFEINYFMTPAYAADGEVTMYFWSEDTYNSVTQLTAENADRAVVMTLEDGSYTACSDEIAAKYLDKTVYAAAVYESEGQTWCSGVLPYSIATYCRNPPAGVEALATAAAIYGCTAKQYFGV